MSIISWISPKVKRLEDEKKELKVELTRAVMKLERSRGEVEQVTNDVLKFMNNRGDRK